MPIQSMIVPPVYATGMIVGKHNLGLHISNAELLRGVASRWRAYPFGVAWDGDVYGSNGTCWTGYHRYRANATILHWDGSGTAHAADHLNITLKYNGVTILTHEVNAGTTEDFSGTHDLSDHGLTDGYLYAVTLEYETESRAGCSITFACPYTTQAGTAAALTFTAPHAVADADDSATTEYAAWRNNDLYFQVCQPSDPAGCMITKGFSDTADDPFYWGWLPERFDRIYYKVVINTNDAGSHVHIIYDPGGANETIATITAAGSGNETFEGSFDIVYGVGGFSEGTPRQVMATVTKGSIFNGGATIYYIRNAPVGDESLAHAYTTLAELVPATDTLPGSTTTKRLTYLNNNQSWLDHGYAIEGRQDFAVAGTNENYYQLRGYDFIRRGDTLNYRVKDCTLEYTGGASVTLLDWDADLPACGYHTLDLTSLADLAYGMEYRIVLATGSPGLNWAEES